MEMEEIFLQLCEEVARLQDLCAKQGKLLQKLTTRKGPILDIPVSLPIQCTEDMVAEEGERPPDGHQKRLGALISATSTLEGSAHPLVKPQATGTLPSFDSKYPPSAGNGSIFGGGTGGAALAVAFGGNEAERRERVDINAWLKTCRMFPAMKAPKEEVRACCSPQEFLAPNPVVGDSFLTLLDLYDAPEALRREDDSQENALPAEADIPVEIRGPVKVTQEIKISRCTVLLVSQK
ncbi:PREDICTED: uncharacterized protein LOC106895994 [Calidris pugnax]|uniref:uncharacterized protein LOC106895994 n=1 Tax=Calidris pugnax TaxID=198806 RepID=UPI00071D346E|nr:PREDICTED: uncharacterized protein LOC106895994 [Calidris pugnax]